MLKDLSLVIDFKFIYLKTQFINIKDALLYVNSKNPYFASEEFVLEDNYFK